MGQKSIAKNVVFNILYKLANMLFPLVTSIYISHILTASGVGKVSIAQNIVQYFILLAPLGIVNYGTREIARIRNCKSNMDKLFTELFLINLCSTIICSIVYYVLIFTGNYFSEERLLFIIVGLPIIFNVINVEWYYQGQEEYVYISIRSICVKFCSLIAMLILIKTPDDYIIYAFIYTLGIVGNYIFNIINLIHIGRKLEFYNIELKKHFKSIFILFCSSIAIELYTLLDTTMLGIMCSDEVVGYYTNAIKLDRIIVGFISAIGVVLLPRLSFYIQNKKYDESNDLLERIVRIMFFLSIPCGIGVFAVADKMVPILFGDTFMPAIVTVKIGTGLIYILAFSNLFGTQVLLSFNQEKKFLFCTMIGALSNLILNLILIPKFKNNGAVIASVISESFVTYLSIVMALKYVKINIKNEFWTKTILSGGVMGFILYWSESFLSLNKELSLFVLIIIGISTFFIINVIIGNPIITEYKIFLKK